MTGTFRHVETFTIVTIIRRILHDVTFHDGTFKTFHDGTFTLCPFDLYVCRFHRIKDDRMENSVIGRRIVHNLP